MISKRMLVQLEKALSHIPTEWDGRKAITEMRVSGYAHWRQMEWIGWYFQFLCDTKLAGVLEIPGTKYGKVEFDGYSGIPWDFKVHPNKSADGQANKNVIMNDTLAIAAAIKEFGGAGLILAIGDAIFNDQDRSFQIWHKKLKGGLSSYEKKRMLRKAPSRLRKTGFHLREIRIIVLDEKMMKDMGSFQTGFRNSDGSPRKAKVLLNVENIIAISTLKF